MIPMSFEGYGLYLLLSLPALVFGVWAQVRVLSTVNTYSKVRGAGGWTGAQVARRILDANGLEHVAVQRVDGFLTDYYDPTHRVLRLSSEVYGSSSLASIGVAAHEAGHAIQDRDGYLPLQARSLMVPSVMVGSWLGPLVFIAGLLMAGMIGHTLAWVGIILFAAVAAFSLVTLPVEFDASRRARALLTNQGIMHLQERAGIDAVLNAAALTYVAAAVQAITTLLYYAFLLLGTQREES